MPVLTPMGPPQRHEGRREEPWLGPAAYREHLDTRPQRRAAGV